jgi:5-methylcytosine-specific restriction endonuclease McrA
MPSIIKKACPCGGTVIGKECDRCGPRKQWRLLGKRDGRWKGLSQRLRAEQPLCVRCERQGVVRAATEVHHKIPVAVRPDLELEPSNCECVCRSCHEIAERESSAMTPPGGADFVAGVATGGRSQPRKEFVEL